MKLCHRDVKLSIRFVISFITPINELLPVCFWCWPVFFFSFFRFALGLSFYLSLPLALSFSLSLLNSIVRCIPRSLSFSVHYLLLFHSPSHRFRPLSGESQTCARNFGRSKLFLLPNVWVCWRCFINCTCGFVSSFVYCTSNVIILLLLPLWHLQC